MIRTFTPTAIVLGLVLGLIVWAVQTTENAAVAAPLEAPGFDVNYPYIQESKQLTVGVDASYFPMEYLDEAGRFQGFDIEYAQALGQKLGLRVAFKIYPLENAINALLRRKVDVVISGMEVTRERQSYVTLIEYSRLPTALISAKSAQPSATKSASTRILTGTIGVLGVADMRQQLLERSRQQAKKDPKAPKLTVRGYESMELLYLALKNGDVTAILVDIPYLRSLPKQDLPGYSVSYPEGLYQPLAIAIHPQERQLAAAITAAAAEISKSDLIPKLIEGWLLPKNTGH